MRDIFPGWYPKSPAEIAALWSKALFVPDANVLLHCLRHPANVRNELLRLIGALGDSLWIPYQVGLEFHRNRLDVEMAALDTYDALTKDQESVMEKARERLRQVRAHPTISVAKELAALDMFISDFRARMILAKTLHPAKEIEQAAEQLTNLLNCKIGEKWKQEQFAAVRRDGDERYSKKIPPGYKDSKKDEGELGKYGDLIIWKDLIAKAKRDQRSVIFITDDVKEDWWWINRGRRIGPRPELVEEFLAESGQDFHIYEFGQFLRFASERFPATQETTAEVQESVLADEKARERLRVLERNERARRLEDERDQIIAVLSGTPTVGGAPTGDRTALRGRLDAINREMATLADPLVEADNELPGVDGGLSE